MNSLFDKLCCDEVGILSQTSLKNGSASLHHQMRLSRKILGTGHNSIHEALGLPVTSKVKSKSITAYKKYVSEERNRMVHHSRLDRSE